MIRTKRLKNGKHRTKKAKRPSDKHPDINTVWPHEEMNIFRKYVPFFNEISAKQSHLLETASYYKLQGYTPINELMNKNSMTVYLNKMKPTDDEKQDLEGFKPRGNLAKSYKKYYKSFSKDLGNIDAFIKTKITRILTNIDELNQLFTQFGRKFPKIDLPILYRGITASVNDELLYNKKPGDILTMRAFQSCSSSLSTSLQFTACGTKGPCCLFRLRIKPEVNALPLFWMRMNEKISESFIYSEHEYLLEPFCQFKITKIGTEKIPVSKAIKCDYEHFNDDGTLTLTVYDFDVLPPIKGAYDDFMTEMKNKLKKLDKYYGSASLELGIE